MFGFNSTHYFTNVQCMRICNEKQNSPESYKFFLFIFFVCFLFVFLFFCFFVCFFFFRAEEWSDLDLEYLWFTALIKNLVVRW